MLNVQTGRCADTKTSVQWISGLLAPLVIQPGREVNQLFLYSAEVKNAWSYTSAPLCAFLTFTGTALLSCIGYREIFSMSGPRLASS